MDVSSKISTLNYALKPEQGVGKEGQPGMKSVFTEKLTTGEVNQLKSQIAQSANMYSFNSANIQSTALSTQNQFKIDYQDFQSFLSDVGYEGKPIAELSKDEASELVSEDGFFGINKTSQRIADFVINGAGGDEDLLRAGREGVLQGFNQAQELWGGELPDISQKTMAKTVELIDMAMNDLGFSILNKEV